MNTTNNTPTAVEQSPTSIKLPVGMKDRLIARMQSENLRSISEVIVRACNDLLSREAVPPEVARRQLLERASEYSEAKSAAIDLRRDVLHTLIDKLGYREDEIVLDPKIHAAEGRVYRGDFAVADKCTVLVRGTVNAIERTLGEAMLIRAASGIPVVIVVPYIVTCGLREMATMLGGLDGVDLVTMEQLASGKSVIGKSGKHPSKGAR
jgi:hypothetical protein